MEKTGTKKIFVYAALFGMILTSTPSFAMLNPAAVYCSTLGYQYTDDGSCMLSDSLSCNGWDFLKGKCGQDYSYCKTKGYVMKTVTDPVKCHPTMTDDCAVCVLPDGTEAEITTLMDLKTQEGSCGDGRCTLGEDYNKCLQDCPSGSFDGLCDGIKDGLCDQDCIDEGTPEKDPDCAATTTESVTTTQEASVTTYPVPTTIPEPETTTPPNAKPFDILSYLPYALALVVLVIVAYFIHQKGEDAKIKKEREEFSQWKEAEDKNRERKI